MPGTKFGTYVHGLKSVEVKWSGMDSEESFKQHAKHLFKAKRLASLGFLDPDCITYRYNTRGFRTEEFDNRPAGIALGCSFTEGVGIPLDATWPSQLSKLLDQHVWNLGVGGGALDTCYSLLEHYIDELNVKFVAVCVPPINRFEFFQNDTPIRVLGSNFIIPPLYEPFFKEWFATETNSQTNQRKNILAMKQLCLQRNIPFYHMLVDKDFTLDAKARDLAHAGVDANCEFAVKMYQLMEQSK